MKIVGNILKWLGIGVYAVCAVLIVMFLMPVGGWKALNVLTGSMKPIIQPGTLVLIHRVPLHDIKRGDIVTYQNPRNFKQTITHRVVKIEKVNGTNMVTVKGDANPTADPPFPGGLIVGRVAMIVPGAGQVINWLHNPFGLAALVIIPGIFVIWAEIRRLQNSLARPQQAAKEVITSPQPEVALSKSPYPVPMKVPVVTGAAPSTSPPDRTRRSLDGMRRVSMFLLLPALALIAIRGTYALGPVGTARLTHSTFTAVNTVPHTLPTSIDDCKKGGWKKFKNTDGTPIFKNQGQCVSFVESHKHDSDKDHGEDKGDSKNNKHNQDYRGNSNAKNSKDDHSNGFSDSHGDSDRDDNGSRSA